MHWYCAVIFLAIDVSIAGLNYHCFGITIVLEAKANGSKTITAFHSVSIKQKQQCLPGMQINNFKSLCMTSLNNCPHLLALFLLSPGYQGVKQSLSLMSTPTVHSTHFFWNREPERDTGRRWQPMTVNTLSNDSILGSSTQKHSNSLFLLWPYFPQLCAHSLKIWT